MINYNSRRHKYDDFHSFSLSLLNNKHHLNLEVLVINNEYFKSY